MLKSNPGMKVHALNFAFLAALNSRSIRVAVVGTYLIISRSRDRGDLLSWRGADDDIGYSK